jgi:hypothetical protein
MGFNPKTQQKIKIPAKTIVKFRVAKAAKDAVLQFGTQTRSFKRLGSDTLSCGRLDLYGRKWSITHDSASSVNLYRRTCSSAPGGSKLAFPAKQFVEDVVTADDCYIQGAFHQGRSDLPAGLIVEQIHDGLSNHSRQREWRLAVARTECGPSPAT